MGLHPELIRDGCDLSEIEGKVVFVVPHPKADGSVDVVAYDENGGEMHRYNEQPPDFVRELKSE